MSIKNLTENKKIRRKANETRQLYAAMRTRKLKLTKYKDKYGHTRYKQEIIYERLRAG